MVKVGFICEGFTELILLQSAPFKALLSSLNIALVNVINAEGSGNLLPHNISGYTTSLENDKAEVIFILTDLDEDVCITKTKQRIRARSEDIVIISVKKIEAWFLADTNAMQQLFQNNNFLFDSPEKEIDPFETINTLLVKYKGRGIGKKTAGKVKLVTKLLDLGFDVRNAANHNNCPSAKYFLNRLTQISTS